ncbi:hypothetical protein [Paeniglutamicibacter antarcticus]
MNKNASKLGRKKKITLVTAALLAVGAGAAIAYWTVGGAGTGTAVTGTSTDIVVNQTTVVTPMYPGDTAQTLSGTFDNLTNNGGPVYVGTVTAAIVSVDKAGGAAAGTCEAADYTLTDAAMTVNEEVPAGSEVGSWTGATIQFKNNLEENQDACKGATVNLAYTVS